MTMIGYHSILHGYLSQSIVSHPREDQLITCRILAKTIKACLNNIRELWIVCCKIIHAKLLDGVEIEERVDLTKEVNLRGSEGKRRRFPIHFRTLSEDKISKLSNANLKG